MANTLVLVNEFCQSSPKSIYRPNFLSAPLAIYSCVSTTSLGSQQPQKWRLFLSIFPSSAIASETSILKPNTAFQILLYVFIGKNKYFEIISQHILPYSERQLLPNNVVWTAHNATM